MIAQLPLADTTSSATARCRWFLLACTLLALALRLPLLGRSVWFDEACMAGQRIGTFEQLIATLYVDIHPPLFVTFMHGWGRLFGDGEFALRLPALLAGLAAIPLTYWTGHRLVGATAARWATVLLALSPVHIWYSAEARLYAPMIACTLLLFGTVDRLLTEGAHRRLLMLVHVTNVVVMLGMHYYLAVIVGVLALAAPMLAGGFTRRARRVLLWHGIGLSLLGVFLVGKFAVGHFETSQDYLRALTLQGLSQFLLDWCWTGHTLLPAEVPTLTAIAWTQQGLGALLLLLGFVAVVRTRQHQPRGFLVLVGLFTLPAFLWLCAQLGYDRTYMERSMLPALPFVFLLAGAGLATLRGKAQPLVGVATLALNVAALIGLFTFHTTHWTVYKPNSDWRSAAAWLGEEIDRDGAGRPVFTSTPNPRSLCYYDPRIQDVKNLALPMAPEQLAAAIEKRLGSWLGQVAINTFRTFAAHNDSLLKAAKLRVYRCSADPAKLDLAARGKDDICYLVRDEWHPHRTVDSSVEDLLDSPRIQLLASQRFAGVQVHKVRVLP